MGIWVIMIGRKSLLIVISKTISAGLGFIGLFLITRNFPESAYGQITYTMSLVALFYSFSDLGFGISHIKKINEGKDPSDCLSSYLVVKFFLIVIMVSTIFVSFYTWTVILGNSLNDTSIQLIVIFTLYYVLYNVSQIATATFDAHLKTAKTQLSLIFEMLIRVPLILFFAVPSGTVYALSLCYVSGMLAVMVVGLILLSREHLKLKRPTLIREMSVFAFPIAVSLVLGTIIANIDKVTLGYFWGAAQVANYAASQSLLSMLFIFSTALGTLLFPTFSRMHEEGDKQSMRMMVKRGERYLSYIITPIVCVFLVYPLLISTVILTSKYAEASDVMQILCLTVLITTLGSVYSTQIIAVNRARDIVWLTGLQLVLLLILIVVFVPDSFFKVPMLGMGAVGTAIAVTLATLVAVILYRVMVWRIVGLGYNKAMTYHLLAAILSIIVLLAISLFYTPIKWYDIILMWVASALTFYLSLSIMKELKQEDVKYFMDVLNPKDMIKYLLQEIKGQP